MCRIELKYFWALAIAGLLAAGAARTAETGTAGHEPGISESRAREIALERAGDGDLVRMRLRQKRDGSRVYSAIMIGGKYTRRVEIDAESGEMIKFNRQNIDTVRYPRGYRPSSDERRTWATSEQAREIALNKAGKGRVIESRKEFAADGRALYRVAILYDEGGCEVEVDADSAEVVNFRERTAQARHNWRAGGKRDRENGNEGARSGEGKESRPHREQ